MKLDITQQLYDLDGKPIKYPEWNDPPVKKDGSPVLDDEGRPLRPTMKPEKLWERFMTLKSVMLDALYATLEEDKSNEGKDKLLIYDLTLRVYRAKEHVELDADELKLVRDRIDNAFSSPFVVAPVWKMLNDLESVGGKGAEEGGEDPKKGSPKKRA